MATNNANLTSYDFMDAIVRALTRKENFPNLKSIVISGHSAGGQFATRYGMANQIHDSRRRSDHLRRFESVELFIPRSGTACGSEQRAAAIRRCAQLHDVRQLAVRF